MFRATVTPSTLASSKIISRTSPPHKTIHNSNSNRRSLAPTPPPATAVASDTGLVFDIFDDGDPIFPELIPSSSKNSNNNECILVGVDPDIHGAIATLRWTSPPLVRTSTPTALAASAHIQIYDMPTETWKMQTRDKKRPSPEAFLSILEEIQTHTHAAGSNAIVRAAVEFTTPGHLSGKFAWYDSGFSTGLITGLFLCRNVTYERVSAQGWKSAMGLRRTGKEGSLALAKQIFPQAAQVFLKRKKDHGRAEALLLAAWALGIRAAPSAAAAVEYTSSSTEEEEVNGDGVP